MIFTVKPNGEYVSDDPTKVPQRVVNAVQVQLRSVLQGKTLQELLRASDGGPMYVPCLFSHWTDLKGLEPELWSFAAITDDPEPEVAAAGHDRTIINIKPEHIDAWLNPDPANLQGLYAVFDDRQHPYYEHQLAA